jgi:hypothetical protein
MARVMFPKPPKRVRRRGHADPVTPDLHRAVVQRDGGCVAAILDREHECRDGMGWPHRWDELHRLTVDHVQDGGGRMGRRAPSDPAHLVAMCHAGNLYWASAHRSEERAYLNRINRR